jgi:hypothetical protein
LGSSKNIVIGSFAVSVSTMAGNGNTLTPWLTDVCWHDQTKDTVSLGLSTAFVKKAYPAGGCA